MRYRGFGKAPKQSNMKNMNNPERSKYYRDMLARRQNHELYSNGKKFKELLKKEAKHNRLHGKRN